MQLKTLEIWHKDKYSNEPRDNEYRGKVAFWGVNGNTLEMQLDGQQLQAIVGILAGAFVARAQQAAADITASLTPNLQIEEQPNDR